VLRRVRSRAASLLGEFERIPHRIVELGVARLPLIALRMRRRRRIADDREADTAGISVTGDTERFVDAEETEDSSPLVSSRARRASLRAAGGGPVRPSRRYDRPSRRRIVLSRPTRTGPPTYVRRGSDSPV
jgi:hypothetical protein